MDSGHKTSYSSIFLYENRTVYNKNLSLGFYRSTFCLKQKEKKMYFLPIESLPNKLKHRNKVSKR